MPACRPLCLALLAVVAAGCTTSVQTERREAAAPTGDARPRADLANGALATQRSMDLAREQKAEAASISLSEPSAPPAPMAPPAQPLATAAVSLGRMPPAGPGEAANRENYAAHGVNPVQRTAEAPVSTFSIDVDTGAYSNVRHMLNAGRLPPADAVRTEEFINYFDYAYTPPRERDIPFSVTTELAPAPWNEQRTLLLVGVQGFRVDPADIPAANLVFLIDTSGSMESPDKLDLLKASFKQMLPRLRAQDRVSIVVYAGSAGLVLPPTPGDQRDTIAAALDRLQAGGSTNGGAGIELAYATAQQAYIPHGVNRVLLATDGDFNVGTVSTEALKTLVADKRKSGIALTTLGFGEGNYNDALAEQLADVGNGNHYYIDTLAEGRKVLQDSLVATLMTIAKDVKIQIEFNPAVVEEYRLVGYQNRLLRREDFNNDAVDAGEIGAGHNVTALYELTLKGSSGASDPLRYAPAALPRRDGELAFLRLRYKQPEGDRSRLIERPIARSEIRPAAGERLRFAAAVAAFADNLRGATHLGDFDLARIAALAEGARGSDTAGYRAEFINLVRRARELQTPTPVHDVAVAR
ncbi:MAG: VWA domain-containing protein [Lysobacterales bacterium]